MRNTPAPCRRWPGGLHAGPETYRERWITPGMDWWTRPGCGPLFPARSPVPLPASQPTLCCCQAGASSVFPSGNQAVRLPVSGPGLPDRVGLTRRSSFAGQPGAASGTAETAWVPASSYGRTGWTADLAPVRVKARAAPGPFPVSPSQSGHFGKGDLGTGFEKAAPAPSALPRRGEWLPRSTFVCGKMKSIVDAPSIDHAVRLASYSRINPPASDPRARRSRMHLDRRVPGAAPGWEPGSRRRSASCMGWARWFRCCASAP